MAPGTQRFLVTALSRFTGSLSNLGQSRLRGPQLLAWEPAGKRVMRNAFRFWFVSVKMTDSFDLGTLTSALARDWQHIDLLVSEPYLWKRGSGIVLDHSLPDGRRLLVWSKSR